jgi:hypothetical protein
MGLLSNFKGIKYRLRIFHDNYHIKTVSVNAKGQRFVTVLVENPLIGQKEKIAFMIPHDIKPFVFQGKELEYNFDIRDACPISDLMDIYPHFIHDLNEDLKILFSQEEKKTIIEAEIKKVEEIKGVEPGSTLESIIAEISKPKEEPKKEDGIVQTVTKKVESAGKVTKDSGALFKEIVRLHLVDDSGKREKVKKIMDLCAKHPKLYYWLPAAMNIDKEVMSLVSAKAIYRAGIMPSYYAAQSGALISEKVLERPKEQPSWITVAIIALVVIFVLGLALILVR